MTLNFNTPGAERKNLLTTLGELLATKAKYLGVQGKFAYQVGDYHLDKDGTLTGPEDLTLLGNLMRLGFKPDNFDYEEPATEAEETSAFEDLQLTEREELGLGRERREDAQGENGRSADDVPTYYIYRAELSDPEAPDRMEVFSAEHDEDAIRQALEFCTEGIRLLELHELDDDYNELRFVPLLNSGETANTETENPATDTNSLTIEMPLMPPEKLDNLCRLILSKETLIKNALGVDALPIQVTDTIRFPWYNYENQPTSEETQALAAFISLLCETAREKKRVVAKEKPIEGSHKYAMRCFLLSIGMIGPEYKNQRKTLLSKLEGNSSWKFEAPPKADDAEEQTAPIDDTPPTADAEASGKSERELIMEQLPEGEQIKKTYWAVEGDYRVITTLPDTGYEKRYTVAFEDGYPRITHMP